MHNNNSHVDSSDDPPTYIQYPKRWLMLFIVCLLNVSNAMLWITYAPVANLSDVYYCGGGNGTNGTVIPKSTTVPADCDVANLLSLVFMIIAIPVGFFAIWSVDKFGLRSGILLGSCATCFGAALRVVSSISAISVSARFPLVIFGQSVAACAQPFIMYLPPKLAQRWFSSEHRTLAQTAGSMSNPLGILLSMVISPAILTAPNHMWLLNVVNLAPAGLAFTMATFFVTSSDPPTPPTVSACVDSLPFWVGLKRVCKDRAFVVLVIGLGGGIGLFNALYTLIEQMLCWKGYDNHVSGLCGALLIVGGVVGSVIAGIIVDKTHMFQEVIKVAFALAGVLSSVLAVLVLHPNLEWAVVLAYFCFGACGFAVYAIGLELGVEITHPVAEATSSGLIIISGQIQGIIFVLLMSMLAQKLPPDWPGWADQKCSVGEHTAGSGETEPQNMIIPNLIFAGLASVISSCFVLFFWPQYRRIRSERNEFPDSEAVLVNAEIEVVSTS